MSSHSEPSADYDLIIVGAGPIGATLACALADRGMRIALLEAQPPRRLPGGFDERSLALAYGSRVILETVGLWRSLRPTPIHRIHVSDLGQPSTVRLDRAEHGVDALGYVLSARELGDALAARLASAGGVELLSPVTIGTVSVTADDAAVTLDQPRRTLRARLLVAADGARSTVCARLGVAARRRGYRQSAIVVNLRPQRDHHNVAYERFTPDGPLALLPLSDRRCSLIYTLPSERLEATLALSDETFLTRVHDRFGDRLGALCRLGTRVAYPLERASVGDHGRPRLAVIGNAAHALHPVAGQGFNLGLRDVAALAEVIAVAHDDGADIGAVATLRRYRDWRRADQRRALAVTDGLARLFSSAAPPLRLARGLGLLGLNAVPGASRAFARRMMGLDGRLPRLAQGRALPTAAERS